MIERVKEMIEKIFCFIGLHTWYIGSYSNPVKGRLERRCLNCSKKEFRNYKPLKWVSYK